MPEFEMPSEVEVPPSPEPTVLERPRATTDHPAHTAEPDASDAHEERRRASLTWRHVLVGVVVGAILGAAVPGGIQLAERAAASADSDGLRAVATDYLTAIAEGRAARASAIVPLPSAAETAPDAVLQSADRIQEAAVRMVHIDGDVGTVEVGFEVGRRAVTHMLEAERADGGWRLTTSLAEGVTLQTFGPATIAQIAGFAVPTGTAVRLYPGTYRFDDLDDDLLRVTSEPFTVDGDAATPVETYIDAQLAPQLAALAGEIGVAVGEACQAQPTCTLPRDGEVRYGGGSWVQAFAERWVDVSVQMMVGPESNAQWFEARMRIVRDGSGAPVEWLCSPIDAYSTPVDPCPEH
jgi:hypothetical protein